MKRKGMLVLVSLLLFCGMVEVYAQNASIHIHGITSRRVDKYNKHFKIRKRFSTEPLSDVQARAMLQDKVINKATSTKDGSYDITFELLPNKTYYLEFSKNGFFPKRFKFNTNGISSRKKINFEGWDFHMYKRVIGLSDSIFLVPTEFYFDSERGYMTYDEEINLPLAAAQEETYLNYLRNLNETDFVINEIEQDSSEEEKDSIATTDTSSTLADNDAKKPKKDVPTIQLLDMEKLLKELNVSKDSDSLIETKQDELSGEWQQLEVAKMKATTQQDKSRIAEAEKLLMEKEKQIRVAQDEIENARKKLVIKEMENKNKTTLLTLAGFILLLAFTLLFVLYRNNKERHRTNMLLSQRNQEVLDSIKYAQRLQNAILPPDNFLKTNLNESFVLYVPKDIVSGDFYWVENMGTKTLFAVVDCTGHGVPGAFMSIVAFNALNQAVNQHNLEKPAEILDQVNQSISHTLHQTENVDVEDGMDISLCLYDTNDQSLQFAGANQPLYLVRNNELKIIRGDKFSIGSSKADGKSFSNHNFMLNAGDTVYIFSDGYPDQFGGRKGKKMMYRRFKELLVSHNNKPLEEQKRLLNDYFHKWKGNNEQVDDVCIMGVKIS